MIKTNLSNPAIYAMEMFQSQIAGEAERAGFRTEEDVVAFLKELRAEREAKHYENVHLYKYSCLLRCIPKQGV